MKMQIVRIADRGIANMERLHLRVLADTSLEFFVVFDTTYTSSDKISNLQRHAYWFRSKPVKAGDNVILYTRMGTPSEDRKADGTTTHFLFWGLDHTIWNKVGDCAVLFEVNSWATSAYE